MTEHCFDDLKIYQNVYKFIDSNMFFILKNNDLLVFDPNVTADFEKFISSRNIQKVTIVLTHEHCDHISGLDWFLKRYNCTIIASDSCAKQLSIIRNTRPIFISFVLEKQDNENGSNLLKEFENEYVVRTYNVNQPFTDSVCFNWNGIEINGYSIPGHTKGSSFYILNKKYVFTGDSLSIHYPVILSFPGGNRMNYLEKTLPLMQEKISHDMMVFPGHGMPFMAEKVFKDGKIYVELR